jgi:hypothetical protein
LSISHIYLPQFAWIFPTFAILAGYAATFESDYDKIKVCRALTVWYTTGTLYLLYISISYGGMPTFFRAKEAWIGSMNRNNKFINYFSATAIHCTEHCLCHLFLRIWYPPSKTQTKKNLIKIKYFLL